MIYRTFESLHSPNYRRWFIGQLFSLLGTWMQSTAQGYLIFELTGSAAYLGYVGFASGLPSWFFTLYGGVIADRVPRRKMIFIAQSAMMLLAFVLAALTFTGLVRPWHILVLAMLLGVANAFDAPARQAFVSELVDRDTLTNAIALNATMFNTATVVGPAAAGLVYAWVGPGWCFLINGLSFISVLISLVAMRLAPFTQPSRHSGAWDDIREGFRFVRGNQIVLLLIVGMGMVSAFGFGVVTLVPVWAVDVLGGDVRTNGLLLSARGAGSLIAAVMTAALGYRNVRGRLWTAGSFLVPLTLLAFSLIRLLPLSLILMVLTGWGLMAINNNANALVQTLIPDELRGRVMGIFTLVFFGGAPLGSLWAGTLADHFGAPAVVAVNAVILLCFAVFIWLRYPIIRRQS